MSWWHRAERAVLDGEANSHTESFHFHTADQLTSSQGEKKEKKNTGWRTWKHTQSLMNISYTHIRHVDTGSTLCGPLAGCITGCFKANYNKNKQAKHFLWCPLPRTISGLRPETIRGRSDTGASAGGEEEGETEKVLKVCFCGRYFTFTASITRQLQPGIVTAAIRWQHETGDTNKPDSRTKRAEVNSAPPLGKQLQFQFSWHD